MITQQLLQSTNIFSMKLTVMDLLFTLLLALISARTSVAFTSTARQEQAQNQTGPPSAENVSSMADTAEQGTKAPSLTGFTFSPIWLKDVSVPEEAEDKDADKRLQEESEKRNEEADKEVIVHESEYVNANSEPIQVEESVPVEVGEDEATSSWHVEENPEDEEEYDQELEDDVLIHESVPEHPTNPDVESINRDHQANVEVKEWTDRTPHTMDENDIVNSANTVSAPWYDVMSIGLPPSVAYNWQFLMDLSGKLRTAPKTGLINKAQDANRDDYNARLKYMLAKIQDAQMAKVSSVKLDTLKQKHLLKAKLNSQTEHEDDMLAWAWRRAAHMQE